MAGTGGGTGSGTATGSGGTGGGSGGAAGTPASCQAGSELALHRGACDVRAPSKSTASANLSEPRRSPPIPAYRPIASNLDLDLVNQVSTKSMDTHYNLVTAVGRT